MSGRYYRRRGYYRNNGYRRSYYWRRGGSTKNKSWGNMKAAKQQADQSTFTINIPSTLGAFLKSDTLGGNVTFEHGVYAMNIYDQLRKSDFFNSYASMYDEFKIDRIKVKLLPTEFTYTASTGGGKYSNVTVYTAWDRTGLNKDQVLLYTKSVNNTTQKIGDKNDPANVDGLYVTIGKDITTYSSAESRVVNPGTNTSIVRWLNPKTMQEKSQWIGTSQLAKWYDEYQVDDGTTLIGRYIGIPTGYKPPASSIPDQVAYDGDIELAGLNVRSGDAITQPSDVSFDVSLTRLSTMNSENPCFLVEDGGIRFKPTLLVGTYPESAANVCKFNVETEVVCTFRGLRKASVVAA